MISAVRWCGNIRLAALKKRISAGEGSDHRELGPPAPQPTDL